MNLTLRKAKKGDSRFLFELRNEEAVRLVSRNTKPIAFSDHEKWFEKKLTDPLSCMLVVEENGMRIAQTRCDVHSGGQEAEISIALISTFRGKGYGTKIIAKATAFFFEKYPEVLTVRAYTNLGNIASVRSFTKADYRSLGEVDDEGTRRHLFVCERQALN